MIMDIQMEKNMENEMETGLCKGNHRDRVNSPIP